MNKDTLMASSGKLRKTTKGVAASARPSAKPAPAAPSTSNAAPTKAAIVPADVESPPKTQSPAGTSPINKEQALKAARALLKYIESETPSSEPRKPNLFDESSNTYGIFPSEPIWLTVTTKMSIVPKKHLKPRRLKLSHPLLDPTTTSALLIVKDPQRVYKDILLPHSPTIHRVIGLSKLRAKFKTFESLRKLRDTHDLILADDRIIPSLRTALGSVFLRATTKVPIPVTISKKNGNPLSQDALNSEIKLAIESTYIHLNQTNSTNVRIGLSRHKPEQLVENILPLLQAMITDKKVVRTGWNGVRGVYIKSTTSAALPLFLASGLYDAEKQLITEEQRKEEKEERAAKKKEQAEKRKARRGKGTVRKKAISEPNLSAALTTATNSDPVIEGGTSVVGDSDEDSHTEKSQKRKADGDIEKEVKAKPEIEGSLQEKRRKVREKGEGGTATARTEKQSKADLKVDKVRKRHGESSKIKERTGKVKRKRKEDS